MNWYIVQAYSGLKKKVVESIKEELKKHKLSENLEEILFQLTKLQKLKSKRKKRKRKFFRDMFSQIRIN